METMVTEKMKEEILMLESITTLGETALAGEIAKLNGLEHITKDFSVLILLGCIYKYGKIQGIREERAKRKKALANPKIS